MTKLTRIEEVKKILKRICAPHFEYWFNDNARQICQLFPQPLDDKELREKIREVVREIWDESHDFFADMDREYHSSDERVDLILALLQPKIEEAKREERERMWNQLLGMFAYPEMVIPMNVEILRLWWQREESNGTSL